MVRHLFFISFFICNFFVFNVYAQEIKDESQKELSTQDNEKILVSDMFNVADVNSDGFISENEYAIIVNGIKAEFNLSEEEKIQKKERFLKYFQQADKNKDAKLDKNEFNSIMQWAAEYNTDERLEKIKKFSEKSPEEAVAEVQKKLEEAKAALEKFKEMPSDKFADNLINSVSNNIADENYFQMDKDKDGCVTEDEYAEYMVVFDKNMSKEINSNFSMTKDEWKDMYKDEKKAKENCLTKEEYIRNYNELSNFSALNDVEEPLSEQSERIKE